jgi:pimeloyl-ACP methyl ester carboxylesterase
MTRLKKIKSIMSIFLYVALICLIGFVIFLLIISPGKPKPVIDKAGNPLSGSMNEKVFMTIGGVRQGMFIRGTDVKNPVLLYVHGGPSFSEYFLVDKYPTGLENYFTVCYWEERGGGLSWSRQVTEQSMTLEQLASDALEVTDYLRNRFKKEKIYILAHSGGSAFAIQAVAGHPQLFHAYIGVSQITRQAESEKLNYKYLLDRYSSAGNMKMVAALAKYPILEDDKFILPFFNSVLRDKSMHPLGIGTMHNMKSIMTGVFYPVWACRAYTLGEKFRIWYAKFSFINKSGIRKQILDLDITAKVPRLDVPVFFISGKYDLTVNIDLSKDYLKKIEAPVKAFYTFEKSAHSPMFEEPDRFLEIMNKDVLTCETALADK